MRTGLEWREARNTQACELKRASLVVLILFSIHGRIFGHREETHRCLFDPTPSGRNSAVRENWFFLI